MKLPDVTFAFLIAVVATPVLATTTFPDGSVPASKDELQQRIAGKAFNVKLADGTLWDIEFKANGTFYVETSKGNKVTGDWKSEQGKLCSWTRNTEYRCGDAMLFQDSLYVKRADGEVIKYVPK